MQTKTNDPLVAYNRRLIEVFKKRRQQMVEKISELDLTIERMSGITDILESQILAPANTEVTGGSDVGAGAF